ncbi:MAG TPA: hypothetical protein VMU58_02120 [Gaiellaceae bacterium]|nr:hypothetical protein [Gaiellaceae bacterium]
MTVAVYVIGVPAGAVGGDAVGDEVVVRQSARLVAEAPPTPPMSSATPAIAAAAERMSARLPQAALLDVAAEDITGTSEM